MASEVGDGYFVHVNGILHSAVLAVHESQVLSWNDVVRKLDNNTVHSWIVTQVLIIRSL